MHLKKFLQLFIMCLTLYNDYYFITKELAEEFKNPQEKALKNTKPLQFQKKNKLQGLIKMEKKLQKIYLTYYNLLIAQCL